MAPAGHGIAVRDALTFQPEKSTAGRVSAYHIEMLAAQRTLGTGVLKRRVPRDDPLLDGHDGLHEAGDTSGWLSMAHVALDLWSPVSNSLVKLFVCDLPSR
jgi:hypothetical protein